MNYLLDTHAFIWLDSHPNNLSQQVSNIISDPETEIYLSAVSVWEMQIKYQIGKMDFQKSLSRILIEQIQRNRIQLLRIKLNHIFQLNRLPLHHRDPFDRMLIAQSRVESMPLLSRDSAFGAYDVQTIW